MFSKFRFAVAVVAASSVLTVSQANAQLNLERQFKEHCQSIYDEAGGDIRSCIRNKRRAHAIDVSRHKPKSANRQRSERRRGTRQRSNRQRDRDYVRRDYDRRERRWDRPAFRRREFFSCTAVARRRGGYGRRIGISGHARGFRACRRAMRRCHRELRFRQSTGRNPFAACVVVNRG